MEALLKRRAIIKGQITKLTTYAKACKDTTPYDEMHSRLEKLKEHYTSFVQIEDEIFSIDSNIPSDIDAIDDNYYLCISTLQRLMRGKLETPHNRNDSILNSSSSALQADFKLPRLSLPTFSGKAREWQSFYDLFKSTVHENTSLSPAQKFQYLIGQLRGPAEALVRHFRVDDASYIEAFQKLVKRFDRKRTIVNEFIEIFMKQPQINKASVETVGHMYDTCDEVTRGLKALGPSAESRDCWLVYLAEKKLDEDTLLSWRLESSEHDYPTIEQFLEFLSKRMNSLEGLKPHTNKSQSRHVAPVKSFYTVQKPSESKALPKCSLCPDQQHRLCDCSNFIEMKLAQRREYLTQSSRCFNCLAEGHVAFHCKSKGRCHQCRRRHHSLVHTESMTSNTSSESTTSNTTTIFAELKGPEPTAEDHARRLQSAKSSHQVIAHDALLPTARVEVRDRHGNWQLCRVLLDSASTRSYITEHCAHRLNIVRANARFNINTLNGGRASSSRGVCSLLMRSRVNNEFSIDVTAYVIPKITSNLPPKLINRDKLKYLDQLPLADTNFHLPSSIDLLIGCDRFLPLLSDGQINGTADQPIAQNTKLGWIVGGNYDSKHDECQTTTYLSIHHEVNIDNALRKFWEIEELPPVEQYTEEEKQCIDHFDKFSKIESSGKLTVSLPFKPNRPALGDSFNQAIRRFRSLEQRLIKNPELHQSYNQFLVEYESLGHMEVIPPNEVDIPNTKRFYLPHHPVIKETSSTTKLRVVFDASAKSTTGVSLNDTLMIGPTVQQTLLEILIRFRKHRFIFTADIEKMFRQLWIQRSDTDYQRILWRSSPSSQLKHYRLLTNTYGTASASFLSTQALNKLANLHRESHPNAAKILVKDFYMDDLMSGGSTIKEAIHNQTELMSLMKLGGYHLRKWAANDVKLLENVPTGDQEISIREITEGNKIISVLGIKFDPQTDCFSFKVSLPVTTKCTKRNMLSEASRVFDPMGWLSPVTVGVKILFQSLWTLKLEWDDELPLNINTKWTSIRNNLTRLEDIKIPRWLYSNSTLDLCGFADASNSAYAAVIYARTTNTEGNVMTNIIAAKTKVAPIKYTTTARLELCAALLLTRLCTLVIKSLELETPPKVSLWTDSTTVLAWLSNPPIKGNVFVRNRVTEILSSTDAQKWYYVPTKQNPADCASRGIPPEQLLNDQLWWQGPEWLRGEPNMFPEQSKINRKEQIGAFTNLAVDPLKNDIPEESIINEIVEKYSSITKAVRILAWVNRVKHKAKGIKPSNECHLTVEEMHESHTMIVREAQFSSFAAEINNLREGSSGKKSNISFLSPFLDNFGVLRVGGRLEHAKENYDMKHPIILSGSQALAVKLIQEAHERNLHAGPTLLMSIIKQQYTILRCRELVRRVIYNCIKCFRKKRQTQQQLMGQLPLPRVNLIRAFLQSSVDYAGPYNVRSSKLRKITTYKAYLVVFTCMATKAIHLELASDMTTDTFLAAFKRFQNRRGICTDVFSDNGTNFVGAAEEIKRFQQLLEKEKDQLLIWATNNNTKWHFIPPAAPHFNGLCEAAVKSVKFHLRRVLGQTLLRYEELNSLLIQIEGLLNSRPLCEPMDEQTEALTPSHFIMGQPITAVPEPNITHLKVNRLSRWQMTQQLFQHVARRWQAEYLTTLNSLSKWRYKTNNIKPGDIVVIRDDNIPPGQWALGRIHAVHPGRDGIVRVVSIKTSKSVLKRPITKICLLPIIDSSDSSTAATCRESQSQSKP